MSQTTKEINIGLIGYGHWGPNHTRVFGLIGCRVHVIADKDPERLEVAERLVPRAETVTDYNAVIDHPEIDAVVVATPTRTHYSLVKAALLADKDVLVEKPITYMAREAEDLVRLAGERGRVLMCGHTLLFEAGIRKLRQYIEDGTLGRIYYMASTRTNLGPLSTDVNALHELGSHDVSVFYYLLNDRPIHASAWGEAFVQPDIEDVSFACLEFPNRTLCHMHVSWINPRKERLLVVVGEKKMAVWNDMEPGQAIRLYDKGVMQEPYYDSFGHFQLVLRDADVLIPKLGAEEPLLLQNRHFLDCVRDRTTPLSDGAFACDVVHALELMRRSMRVGGSRQFFDDASAR